MSDDQKEISGNVHADHARLFYSEGDWERSRIEATLAVGLEIQMLGLVITEAIEGLRDDLEVIRKEIENFRRNVR